MPAVCSSYNCTNRSNKTTGISYYKFPLKNKKLTKQWVVNMKRDNWFPTTASYLCSAHFEEKYMYQTNDQRRLLSNAVPTIFSFPPYLQRKDAVLWPASKNRALEESTVTLNEELIAHMPSTASCDHHTYCLSDSEVSFHKYLLIGADFIHSCITIFLISLKRSIQQYHFWQFCEK